MPLDPKLVNALLNSPENFITRIDELDERVTQLETASSPSIEQITGGRLTIADLIISPAEGVLVSDPQNVGYTGSFIAGDGLLFSGIYYVIGNVINGVLKTGFTDSGTLYAVDAEIEGTIIIGAGSAGGWQIDATRIFSLGSNIGIVLDSSVPKIQVGNTAGNHIVIDGANQWIRSSNFVAGATGFNISAATGDAEFNNLVARGMIKTAVFQKDVVSSVGGSLLVMDSDVLDADMTALDSSTLTIKGTTTFAVGDIVRMKDEGADEWMEITDASAAPTYTVTRDKAGVYASNNNPTWSKGQAVVNYGQAGSGGIQITGGATPTLNLFTHTGTPWIGVNNHIVLTEGSLTGYAPDGTPTFWISPDDGSGRFLGGSAVMDSNGLSINGLSLAQYFLASNAGNQRQAWLGMYLPQGGDTPVWSIIYTGPDAATIVVNGDAETGDETGWTDADAAWSPSTTSPYAGTYSFKHNSSAEVFPGTFLQNVAVTGGAIYSFGFASRLESGILSPYATLTWKTSAPAVISTETIYGTHSTSWQFSQQSFTAPATAASVDIELYPGDPFNDCYFDGIVLFEQAISTELRLSDHALTAVIDGETHSQNPFVPVSTDPAYIDQRARFYFTSAGEFKVRMKLGANEKETLLATLQTTIDIPLSADTFFDSSVPTTNFDTNTQLIVGENNAAVQTIRQWIKPDFSSVPTGVLFISAVLKLTPIQDISSNARTMYAHRCLRDVVSSQATWNIWKTSNNWGTAGASNSTTDYEGAVVMGSMPQPASPTLNVALEMTLDASELQKLFDGTYVNNGIILFVDTQLNDMIIYASRDHATAAYRPVITLTYV
jgi:uncharacterized glyoxalase superfamily protein PhnB